MNKAIPLLVSFAALAATASAQSVSGTFDFSSAAPSPTGTFSSNGFTVDVTGLSSSTFLDQNLSTVTLNATPTNILVGEENGIGAGPYSDNELRNGAGTPSLSGATLLELSNITTPTNTAATSLNLKLSSVDSYFGEGFLVYGSNGDAAKGTQTLTLLGSGKGDANDVGTFAVGSDLLSKYSNFYVTADNGFYSSVLLSSGTSVNAQSVPEPMTMLGLAAFGLPFLRRKKKA